MGFVFALLAAFSWALAATFYRRALLDASDPLFTNLLRIPLALIFLAAYSMFTGDIVSLLNFFDDFFTLLTLFIATIIMNVIGDTVYLLSIRNVGVSIAYPVSYSYPLLVALIAFMFLNEEIYLSLLAGTIIAISGIWLLSRKPNSSDTVRLERKRFIIGILSAVCAALLWSIGIVIFKVSVMKMNPISVAILKLVFLFILVSPSIRMNYDFIRSDLNREILFFAMIGGLFGVGIGDLFFYMSLNEINASVAASITTISPLFTLLLAIFYLHERVNIEKAIGTLLIVLGVTVVYLKPF